MIWVWYFILYSFIGFILEVIYSKATNGSGGRKCLLVLPLCPVYGLGACAILLLPPEITSHPLLLFLFGGLIATAVEYGVALFYEWAFQVSFWNYQGLPGNLHGRVCLPFSLIWGVLTLPLVYGLHPALSPGLEAVPLSISWLAFATLLTDSLVSAALLRKTGDRGCLRWYAS